MGLARLGRGGSRAWVIVLLIVLGLLFTRVLGRSKPHVGEDRAVAIAQPKIDFTPQGHTIRLVQRGIPPRKFWAVSFWTRKQTGGYERVTVVLVDAQTGRIDEVDRTR